MDLERMWRRSILASLVGCVALAAGGCMTFNEKAAKYRQPWEEGQFQVAADKVNEAANARVMNGSAEKPLEKWDRDTIVYLLEQGSILRTVDQLPASNKAFERADRKMQAAWDRPSVQVSSQVLAVLDNLGALPYDGFAYDHVMARTYMALNNLQIGNIAAARERLIATEKAQRDYMEKRAKAIEDRKAKLVKENPTAGKADVSKAKGPDGKPAFADLDGLVAKYSAYKSYRNPFSTWLYGVYMMSAPADTQDTGSATAALKMVAGMVPQNRTVQADLATATAAASGQPVPPSTYVVFETGLAPIRGEIVVWLPIPTGRGMTIMKLAFPKLVVREGHQAVLAATAEGVTYQTEPLASIDGLVAREFKDELPLVITRSVISSMMKAAATAAAMQAAGNDKNGVYLQLGILVASAVYQEATTRADLRQWAVLPKEFQVCRIPTPADRTITLSMPTGPTALKIPDGNVNLVYVKSISTKTPSIIWQAKIK